MRNPERTHEVEADDHVTRRARRRRVLRWSASLVLAVIVLVFLLVPDARKLAGFVFRVGEGVVAESSVAPFYDAPTPTPAAPGTIVRLEPITGTPDGARAWRLIYHSTDVSGADILVSGVVVVPASPAPAGGRTVISWAHPTTGSAPRCAPSSGIAPFVFIEGLTDLLAAGNVVVATDYSGMGVAGPPSYLIGATEAANVLDIVRAARTMDDVDASNRVVLWGHSQGGHAALFAAQEAASYAPELSVAGVAVAAPATELGALLDADIGDVAGVSIGAYAFTAYADAYASRLPADPLTTILTDAGAEAAPSMARLCLLGQNDALHAIAKPLIGGFISTDPATAPGWSELLAENSPTLAPLLMPLFVAQGAKDTLVRPEITAAYVASQQQAGTRIESHVYPDKTHATVATAAIPDLLTWMRALP
ncbi:Secretory lipase [Sanguibacter gelidistatuariae]|uniref:Secretory lipase n=1 Tax=Sanguibacter gelidistatuariae TaxID=1814289 RepID=A0A1G6Q4D3_9MICO|nr:alpha/beta fold hydrolase [Sanguibacter gelidistatuariae]SDC86784.1 Secretory lipase [Sanguibacter gelidistatuariae]